MENMNKKVKRMARGNAKRKLWHRAVAIPAAIVVFVTTYALILPAIAMERDTYCGLEAHQHTAECYTAELACGYEDGAAVQDVQLVTELACGASAHQHTADCYDETGAVICGYADYLVHEHTADCYAADGTLVCPLPQVEAHTHDENCYIDETVNVCGMAESEGHIHTADCYSLVSHPELVCGMAESAGHIHTADCYTTRENTYLACGMAESAGHIHGEGCYVTTVAEDGTETTELVCTEPESMGHTHTEACYATETVTELTCGQAESAGHTHTDACWANVETLELTCGQAESAGHTHTDACYATQKRLVCPKPEVILHTHNDDCYTVTVAEDGTETRELTCTQTVIQEHVHTADCFHTYEQTIERPHEHTDLCYIQTLTCTLPEHEHTEECYVAPEIPEVPETPEYICGLQGHTHTELCYDEAGELICGLEEHVHDETCLPVEIADGEPVEMGGEPDGNVQIVEDDTPAFQMPVLACGLAEHEHSTSCMDENMNYVCGLTAHAHTGDCYEIPGLAGVTPELVCDKHEHFHTEACYNENGEIACGLDEHTHGVGCFALPEGVADPDAAQAPGIDENTYWCGFEAHEHTEACLDANGVAVCGLPEHQHTDQCLVEPAWYCGYEAHTHGEGCYDETGALICGLPEHTHSDACKVEPTWYCGKTAHTHGESCYDENGALICGLEEHVHTADCKVQHFTQMAYADGVMVTASYTSEAGLPIDAVLQVTRFTEGEHYEARVNEASEVFHAANPDQLFQPQALLNIGFYLPDGTEVEPAAPVDVTVQLVGEDGLAEGEQYTVIHYGAAGTELLDVAEGEASVNFTAESFSDFLINYDMDPSDGGSTVADGEQNEGEQQVDPSWAPFNPNYILGSYSPNSQQQFSTYAISGDSSTPTATVFEHHKTIDYLGDNQNDTGMVPDNDNPDTDVDNATDKAGVTDDLYRLYLDMEGESKPVDLLIVLDRSGSMHSTGTKENPRPRRDKQVETVLFGYNGNGDGLIKEFLSANDGKSNEAEKNRVAMVWYAGKSPIYYYFEGCVNANGRYASSATSPYADTESGVSFDWTSSYSSIGYNNSGFAKMVEGGINATSGGADSVATNYVAGFVQAHDMLAKDTYKDSHKQVVIFISDGVPTLYYYSGEFAAAWGDKAKLNGLTRWGYGADSMTYEDTTDNEKNVAVPTLVYNYATKVAQDLYKESGTKDEPGKYIKDFHTRFTFGTYDGPVAKQTIDRKNNALQGANLVSLAHSPYYAETAACFEKFWESNKDIDFFTLGIDMSTVLNSYNEGLKRTWVLDKMAEKYGRSTIETTSDPTALKNALRQIMFPSGVSISDELSEYVGLYEEPDVKVTAYDKIANTTYTLWEGTGVNEMGKSMPDNTKAILGNTAGKQIVTGVTYESGVITVKFRDDYCLNKNCTYTLSFNVRLTEKAYNDYADMMNSGGQYSDVGDKDGSGPAKTATTDYGGNQTSSGKRGFYSNKAARVDYTIDDTTYHQFYDRPVVQAWGTQFKFLKTADDKKGGVANMPFQLQKWDGIKWVSYDTGNITVNGVKATKTDDWYLTGSDGTIDFGYLGEKGEYRLVEKVPAEYSSNVGLSQEGQEVVWMTFTVEKGRIIKMDVPAEGVTWDGDEVSTHDSYDFNSEPNTNYYSGEAKLTVENQSYKKDLEIYKTDSSGKNMLAGAKFLLSKKNEMDAWDALNKEELEALRAEGAVGFNIEEVEDKDLAYLVSGETGLAFKGSLPYGTYRLTEESAPLNYSVDLGELEFTVDENGIKAKNTDAVKVTEENDGTGTIVFTVSDKPVNVDWQLRKVDASNEEVRLKGAEFTIYGPYDKAFEDEFNAEGQPVFYTGRTNADGALEGTGDYKGYNLTPLTAGMYYYMVETKAPDGFNKIDGPIMLHATETEKDGERKMTLTASHEGSQPLKVTETKEENGSTLYTVTVVNNTGYELPESGGIGTTVYTLSGLALLALAGAMFCANRRRARG